MVLYSYVLKWDKGFAPNPYGGFCTLACCKPVIRRKAVTGNWIMGTFPKRYNPRRLAYLMHVDEVLTHDHYYRDKRFQSKKPSKSNPFGDNIYFKKGKQWKRHPLAKLHKEKKKQNKDLKVDNVCIGKTFYYFGGAGPKLPSKFRTMIKAGQNHRKIEADRQIRRLVKWVKSKARRGINGKPRDLKIGGCSSCDC